MTTTKVANESRVEAAKREIVEVPIARMFVDPTYQRRLVTSKAERMAANFDWDAFGVPVLSRRADGLYAEVDCQHRVEAAKIAGHGDAEPMCEVFYDLTIAEEATLFRMRNDSTKVPLIDRFRARVIEGEPDALAMVQILTRHGWKLSTGSSGEGVFSAVGKLEVIYRMDPWSAEQAIGTLTRAWGKDPAVLDGRLVEGIGRVYVRFGEAVDRDGLVTRLAKFPGAGTNGGQAISFLSEARGLQRAVGGTVGVAVGEKVIAVYNVNRKKTGLPSLRSPVFMPTVEDQD